MKKALGKRISESGSIISFQDWQEAVERAKKIRQEVTENSKVINHFEELWQDDPEGPKKMAA